MVSMWTISVPGRYKDNKLLLFIIVVWSDETGNPKCAEIYIKHCELEEIAESQWKW